MTHKATPGGSGGRAARAGRAGGDARAALSPFMPLLAQWQQAASALLVDSHRSAREVRSDPDPEALQLYRAALDGYTDLLTELDHRGSARLNAALTESAAPSTGLLRRFLREAEHLYLETVATAEFATMQAELVHRALALVPRRDPGRKRRPTPRGAAGQARIPPSHVNPSWYTAASGAEGFATLRAKLDAAARVVRTLGAVRIGATQRQRVARFGQAALYHYRPTRRSGLAVLIVYAFVNRPEVLDLEPGRTLIGALVARGIHVYLLDWGEQAGLNPSLTLDRCVNGLLDRCVRRVCRERRRPRIHLLGVCQGGTLSLCYAALHPRRIATLTTMVTPVDFQTPDDLLSRWVQPIDVDRLVDTIGDVPGPLLNWLFLALKPLSLGPLKYLDLATIAHDPERLRRFVRMEAWINDSPDQPAEFFREFLKSFYQHNELMRGSLRIGRRRVDLREIKAPILNIYARHDHIVPPAASLALGSHLGSHLGDHSGDHPGDHPGDHDYTVHAFDGGHIGIYVSSKAQTSIPRVLGEWLNRHAARSLAETV